MKVYLDNVGERRLIGRADVPSEAGPVWIVRLFGSALIIKEHYTIGTVTHVPDGGARPLMERAVLLARGQPPELLPGWQALAP
ncbi:hypothetical protein [Falsiroseomonas sp. E2-1-a20]|uniref:hypothetical protein n=1 Tax=Falsiroseomonas sp. E2-1-a20 TaxID=3239300 RepID=UPI003F379B84